MTRHLRAPTHGTGRSRDLRPWRDHLQTLNSTLSPTQSPQTQVCAMRKFRSFTEKAELPPEAPSFRCACSRVWPFPFSAPAAAGPQHLLPSHDPGADAPGEQIESPHLAGHMSVLLRQERDARLTNACIQGPLFHSAPLLPGLPRVQGSRLLTQMADTRSQWATLSWICVSPTQGSSLCASQSQRGVWGPCAHVYVSVCLCLCVYAHTPPLARKPRSTISTLCHMPGGSFCL